MSGISKFKRIYSEGVVNYSTSEEMEENVKVRRGVLRGSESQVKRLAGGAGGLTPDAAAQLGPKAIELQKQKAKKVDIPSFVKSIKKEEFKVEENTCWKGYKKIGDKIKKGRNVPNCVPEEFELGEAHMKSSDVKKEETLKKKYDPSEMKASMIKQYGPEKGKQVYFATIRKQAMKESSKLDEAKLPRVERQARAAGKKGYDVKGRPTSKGGVHAFDVDETLFSHGVKGKPNVKVHVKDSSGKRVKSLTNQEFNTHKLDKGHSFDFSEFRSAGKFSQTASPNKKVINQLKRLQKRGKNVQLITARDKFDKPEEFRQHFVRHGIKLAPGNIHYAGGMKDSDIGKKKVAIAKGLAKMGKTSSVHMYDDAAKVHKAFEAEKGKTPKLKIKTHLAKPNKKGEVMTRSYQATKEEFEIWIEALLDEGYDLSEFTFNNLYEAYIELDEASTTNITPPMSIENNKKGLNYKSPYGKKEVKEEKVELSPYEFWKTFIGEEVEPSDMSITEETEEIVKRPPTSYDYWKSVIAEKGNITKL